MVCSNNSHLKLVSGKAGRVKERERVREKG